MPPLWQFEVTNVLLVAERQSWITEAQAARFLDLLTQLPIRVDASLTDPAALLAVGRHHGLSDVRRRLPCTGRATGRPVGNA